MHRRPAHSKRNNRLNLMIAGPGGCGKSTFVNTLCGGHQVANTTEWLDANPAQAAQPQPLRLRTYTEDIADPDLGNLTLRMVETMGLGDNLDNGAHISDILRYIEGQYDEVLAEESRIKRNPRFTDNRVHAVVYMIEATGHGLREQDVEFIRRIGPIANVIPVIAKADALTPAEVLANKRLIHEDIEMHKLPIYEFIEPPSVNEDDDEEATERSKIPEEEDDHATMLRRLQDALPFAVVGSNHSVSLGGERMALVRQYPWGVLHVEDPKVSDYPMLRDLLLFSHIHELKESTTDYLYERYRTLRLSQEPDFNAANAAAAAPVTASRANLAAVAQGQGARSVSGGSANGQAVRDYPGANQLPNPYIAPVNANTYPVGSNEYVARENRLRQEEKLLHRDGRLVQSELEQRRQELRKRELELAKLEERLRQESQQVPPSASVQHRIDNLH